MVIHYATFLPHPGHTAESSPTVQPGLTLPTLRFIERKYFHLICSAKKLEGAVHGLKSANTVMNLRKDHLMMEDLNLGEWKTRRALYT